MNINRRALLSLISTFSILAIQRPMNLALGFEPVHLSRFQSDESIRLPDDLIDLFSGSWSGLGEFASGKKIEAELIFAPELDRHWLVYRPTDRSPNVYKALGMWGGEARSKRFIMTVNDNFGGARRFSSRGGVNGKIVFEKIPDCPLPANTSPPSEADRRERFTFERKDADAFKMTYETARRANEWCLGDFLVFKRKL